MTRIQCLKCAKEYEFFGNKDDLRAKACLSVKFYVKRTAGQDPYDLSNLRIFQFCRQCAESVVPGIKAGLAMPASLGAPLPTPPAAVDRESTKRPSDQAIMPDRRNELGACLNGMQGWGGLTVDLLVARLVDQDAARLAFDVLTASARQRVGARGAVVVYGNLRLPAEVLLVAGIICPVWDTKTNMLWLAEMSLEGLQKNGLLKVGDQSREQLGWPASPLTVYDFVAIDAPSQ